MGDDQSRRGATAPDVCKAVGKMNEPTPACSLEVPAGIVFDLDGTLVDTTYIHTVAWWQAFQLLGHVVPMSRLHRAVGMGADRLLTHVLGELHDSRHDDDLVRAHDVLFATWHEKVEELPGACHLVAWCHQRGLTVSLASSSGGTDLEAMLRVLEHPDFDVIVTLDDVADSKPSPDLVATALSHMGLEPAEVLVVGDAVWDIHAANAVGARSVGLECGGTSRSELLEAGATWTFANPEQLCRQLEAADEVTTPRLG